MSETEGDFEPMVFRPGQDPAPKEGGEIEIEIEEPKPKQNSDIVKADKKKDEDDIEVVHEDEPKKDAKADKKPDQKGKADDELSERVQKRINKLTARLREAERKAQEAEQQASQFRQRYEAADNFAFTNFEQRAQAEMAAAEREYTEAYRTGNEQDVLKAQRRLNQAQFDLSRAQMEKTHREGRKPPQQGQPQGQAPQMPPATRDWISANKEWFGDDSNDDNAVRTAAAYAIDARLKAEGWDYTSDEFYEELDARLALKFPSGNGRQTQTAVAAPSRGGSPGGKPSNRVTLTAEERRIAKALQISERDYAMQKLKDMQQEAN